MLMLGRNQIPRPVGAFFVDSLVNGLAVQTPLDAGRTVYCEVRGSDEGLPSEDGLTVAFVTTSGPRGGVSSRSES